MLPVRYFIPFFGIHPVLSAVVVSDHQCCCLVTPRVVISVRFRRLRVVASTVPTSSMWR